MKKEIDINYIAGLFDGEGSISITHRNRYNSKQYALAVTLCNAHKHTLLDIKEKIGFGCVVVHKAKIERTTFNYLLSNKNAYLFLVKMVKHLRIKDKEAEIAIAFYENTINKFRASRWDNEQKRLKDVQRIALSEKYKEDLKNVRYKDYY
jgi:hypothetical protein